MYIKLFLSRQKGTLSAASTAPSPRQTPEQNNTIILKHSQ